MRRTIIALLLLLFATGVLANDKVIKDPAEEAAYRSALADDPLKKRAMDLEEFVAKYPSSVVKLDALEAAMTIYQQIGDAASATIVAERILRFDPSNIKALAFLCHLKRRSAENGDAISAREIHALGKQGLKAIAAWRPPDEMSEVNAQHFRQDMTVLFGGACGYGAFLAQDYQDARSCYLQSVRIRAELDNLKDVYQLGVTERKLSNVTGFWYLAKAVGLVNRNPQLTSGFKKFKAYENGNLRYRPEYREADYFHGVQAGSKGQYHEFHGTDLGWDRLVAVAESQDSPPPEFDVKPEEIAARQAVLMVTSPVDPAELSFCDWEYVLAYRDKSPANKEAAEKVWSAIQARQEEGRAIQKLPTKIISSDRRTVTVAVCEENKDLNRADVSIVMNNVVPIQPRPGEKIDALGFFTDYTPDPFMFIMKGQLKTYPPVGSPAAPRSVGVSPGRPAKSKQTSAQ